MPPPPPPLGFPPPPELGGGVVDNKKKDVATEEVNAAPEETWPPQFQVCRTPVLDGDLVATGVYKKHFKRGSCNRRESSFRHHGINNADFNVMPEETRTAFFKECSGLSGVRLVQYAKESLDKYKTEEQSSGREQKWRPIKCYTDTGFKEDRAWI